MAVISRSGAAEIARESLAVRTTETVDGKQARVNVYGLTLPLDGMLGVHLRRQPPAALRSSVVVIVAKDSGEELYYGRAADEE